LATSLLRLTTSNFIFQLNTYVTSYLTRTWVCCLHLFLVFASAVIPRSVSRGTDDHILLSQIRDSPNLEGQVRIFISPRTGCLRHGVPFLSPPTTRKAAVEVDPASIREWLLIYDWTNYIVLRRFHRKHNRYPAMVICEPHRKHHFLYCCIYNALHSNGNYPSVDCIFVVAYCSRLYLSTGCLPRLCLRRNMFFDPVRSRGSVRHNMLESSYQKLAAVEDTLECVLKCSPLPKEMLLIPAWLSASRYSFKFRVLVYMYLPFQSCKSYEGWVF
jgi:hypothetical protein